MNEKEKIINVTGFEQLEDLVAKMQTNQIAFCLFFSPYCGPCHITIPVFKKLASEFEEHKFVMINLAVAPNRKIAREYEIEETPTIIVIRHNEIIGEIIGFYPEKDLKEMFQKIIKSEIMETTEEKKDAGKTTETN